MNLPPFVLDQWLRDHDSPSIRYNLGGSTGPSWNLQDVLALETDSEKRLFGAQIKYTASAGNQSLREVIARMHGVEPEHIVVVAGCSEALLHVFFLAAEAGGNVLVPFPGFPPYTAIPAALGLEVRHYHLRRDAMFRVDHAEVERLVDSHTRLLLVNSPHNPTGAVLSEDEMQRLHDFATSNGVQFVSDEVFHPIYHGRLGASAEALQHATVVSDFSKALSLPGLRLGWILERDDTRRNHYVTARQYFTISNNVFGQILGEIAIRHRGAIWAHAQQVSTTNLRQVDSLIAENADALEWVRPQGGTIGFPRLRSGEDARLFCVKAARAGLLMVPGDCFAMPDHIRIGFGYEKQTFPGAMKLLSELLQASTRR